MKVTFSRVINTSGGQPNTQPPQNNSTTPRAKNYQTPNPIKTSPIKIYRMNNDHSPKPLLKVTKTAQPIPAPNKLTEYCSSPTKFHKHNRVPLPIGENIMQICQSIDQISQDLSQKFSTFQNPPQGSPRKVEYVRKPQPNLSLKRQIQQKLLKSKQTPSNFEQNMTRENQGSEYYNRDNYNLRKTLEKNSSLNFQEGVGASDQVVRQFNNFLNHRNSDPKPQRPRDIRVPNPNPPIKPQKAAHQLYSKIPSNTNSQLDSPIQFKNRRPPSRTIDENSISNKPHETSQNPANTSTDSFNTTSLTRSKNPHPHPQPHPNPLRDPNPLTLTTAAIARNYMGSKNHNNAPIRPQVGYFGINSDRANFNASKKIL